jgi:hypothetical protein
MCVGIDKPIHSLGHSDYRDCSNAGLLDCLNGREEEISSLIRAIQHSSNQAIARISVATQCRNLTGLPPTSELALVASATGDFRL